MWFEASGVDCWRRRWFLVTWSDYYAADAVSGIWSGLSVAEVVCYRDVDQIFVGRS